MAKEKIYPKGINTFTKHAKAPDFVLCDVIVTLDDLFQFTKDNPQLCSEYQGKKQLKLQMLQGNDRPYFVVNDYRPNQSGSDDQPF